MIDIVDSSIARKKVVESVAQASAGAIVTFDGTIRNKSRNKPVTHLYYEAHPEMALKELKTICDQAMHRWPLNDISIVHRVGRMEIGESSVFIAVSSAHRVDAFAACQFAIDTLKTTVPIWKKEHYEDGEVWIEGYKQ